MQTRLRLADGVGGDGSGGGGVDGCDGYVDGG